ncbi:MAG: GNAT family N-acetyltransferase [Deltaproteobacteria bacterium]|nr:GNAT family N-acetyltransferase [Candidatus Zymogenaceae bacterium]
MTYSVDEKTTRRPIAGRAVVLVPMTPADVPEFYRMATQSDSAPYWYGELYGDTAPTYDDFQIEYPAHYFDASAPRKGRCFFIAVGTRRIGTVAYNEIDERDGSTELDIIIACDTDTGRGYGPDALETLTGFLFDCMSVRRCFIVPIASNLRAIRAYEKAGFRRVKKFSEGGRKYTYYQRTNPAADAPPRTTEETP